jgi:ADP-ribose pyrophosphatase
VVYRDHWFSVEEDKVELPNRKITAFTIIKADLPTMNCVGVVPFLNNGRILLVRQYRYRYKFFNWEIPTGVVTANETFEEAAQRELQEETGYVAEKLIHLKTFHPNMSIVQTAHIFMGENLKESQPPAGDKEAAEFILNVKDYDFDEALRMVMSGEIRDSLSIIGILCSNLRRLETKKEI